MTKQDMLYRISYTIDIVFCIDCTSSMKNVLDMVKENALKFYQDIIDSMAKSGKCVSCFRAKVVAFRDYIADKESAMMISDFFKLPDQKDEFECYIRSLNAYGGGEDEPEDGLEALAYAIRSDWNMEGMKRKQIIVVWTDAPTHSLGHGMCAPGYPKNMARNMMELRYWWGGKSNEGFVDQRAKRLLLFTPDEPGWSDISNEWDNVIHFPVRPGESLKEIRYNEIFRPKPHSLSYMPEM